MLSLAERKRILLDYLGYQGGRERLRQSYERVLQNVWESSSIQSESVVVEHIQTALGIVFNDAPLQVELFLNSITWPSGFSYKGVSQFFSNWKTPAGDPICSECKGKGEISLFTSKVPCHRCNGNG